MTGSGHGGSGMTATVTKSAARSRGRLPRASTTPGKLWLARAGLVILCLAWGALAAMAAGCAWGLSRRLAEYR